jgi:hypothetical protein
MFDRAGIAFSIAVVLGITSGAFASTKHHRYDTQYGHYDTHTGSGPYGYVGAGRYGYPGAYGYAGPYGYAGYAGPYGYGSDSYGYAGVGPQDYAAMYGYGSGAILIQDRDYSSSSGLPY